MRSLRQGLRIWNVKEEKNTKTKRKTRKTFRLYFLLNEECSKLLSSLGIDHRMRKTIPLWNSTGENEFFRASLYICMVSTLLGTV